MMPGKSVSIVSTCWSEYDWGIGAYTFPAKATTSWMYWSRAYRSSSGFPGRTQRLSRLATGSLAVPVDDQHERPHDEDESGRDRRRRVAERPAEKARPEGDEEYSEDVPHPAPFPLARSEAGCGARATGPVSLRTQLCTRKGTTERH